MDHQPFEDWLLDEGPLNSSERKALHAHLEACEQCTRLASAFSAVDQLLRSTPGIMPQSGFVDRWYSRLQQQRLIRKSRYSWGVFLFSLGMTGIIFLIISVGYVSSFQSISHFLVDNLYAVSTSFTIVTTLWETLFTMLRVLPLSWWSSFLAMVSVLSMLWLVMISQLSYARRSVR